MSEQGIWLYRFSHLGRVPGLVQAVSGRLGGVSTAPFATLNLSTAVGDRREDVLTNRRLLAEALGVAAERLIRPSQVHGTDCLLVGAADLAAGAGGPADSGLVADGLLAVEPGVFPFMSFADCVPVLFCDPVRGVVGLVHAGWKGTVAGAGRRALREAVASFGTNPADVLVGIGPSIGPCCYEVGAEVAQAARAAFPGCERLLRRQGDGVHLDLWRANAYQLESEGVPAQNIEVAGLCTACRTDLFFSHRAEKGRTGRMGAVVGWRE
ncbi:MAG: peptidoglycan editing factor PgeF [Chloroflexota bacterium]